MKCECGKEHPDWVPQDRLSKVVAKRKEAEEARDAAVQKASELEASMESMGSLQTQFAELKASHDNLTTRAAIMAAGIIDPEDVMVVEAVWAAKPADSRPSEGLAGWLTSPDDLPRAVRACLPQPEASPASTPAAEQGAPASPPPPTSHRPPGTQGARTGQPAGQGKLTPQQIRQMDPAEYKAWRAGGGVQAFKGGR